MITRIDFIKSTDIVSGTVTYSTNQIYKQDMSPNSTSAGFDSSYSIPRAFRFVLDSSDSFFVNFMRNENTIGEFSLYFIRAYDENDSHVYSGLMKRTDYNNDLEKQEISILAKDFTVLLSSIKNLSLSNSDKISSSLDDRSIVYDYYVDQASLLYFNNAADLLRNNNFVASIKIEELEYNDKNTKLIDIINMFTSLNNHVVRCDIETIVFEDSDYGDFGIASVTIDENDFIGGVDSSVASSPLDSSVFTNNLKDDQVYQNNILAIFRNSNARFASAVDTKLPGIISSIVNTYTLQLNQIIRIFNKNYVIKSINEKLNRYEIILWNAKNPPTGLGIHLGASVFNSATNPSTSNGIHLGANLRNSNTTSGIHLGTNQRNEQTSDGVHLGSNQRNDSTTDGLHTGSNQRNDNTTDGIHLGGNKIDEK